MAGTVTISVEIELGWGIHDRKQYDHLSDDGGKERRCLYRLLDACDDYGIPISFDIVGHLLLHECEGDHPGPYPAGWFDEDPGTDMESDPLFYAPDIATEIARRRTDHEICTHTFSHVVSNTMPPEVQKQELEHAQHLHESIMGDQTESLVPPRHVCPSLDALTDHGIEIVRIQDDDPASNPVQRFRELLFGPPLVQSPELNDGLVETYCTQNQNLTAPSLPSGRSPPHPAFRWLPIRTRQRLHERYLRTATKCAIERDSHLHLWCHLFDLNGEYQLPPITSFLETLGELEQEGTVEVKTMRELNEEVRSETVTESDRRNTHYA